jgi:hypothetical protein
MTTKGQQYQKTLQKSHVHGPPLSRKNTNKRTSYLFSIFIYKKNDGREFSQKDTSQCAQRHFFLFYSTNLKIRYQSHWRCTSY